MKQEVWPESIEGKPGMYCEQCGLVVYAKRYSRVLKLRCPKCRSNRWYYICEGWQPKARYGSIPYKVCVNCGTVIFGGIELCPECGGKLREVSHQ